MNIIIRKAKIEEANIANSFLTKLIRDEKKYDDNINENIVINNYYENYIDKGNTCLLFALIDNKIVGYIYGFIKNDGNTVINKVALLDALYVDIEYRKLGVATTLINEFKNWFKDIANSIEVNVCYQNESAVKLYKKHNFIETKMTMECDL